MSSGDPRECRGVRGHWGVRGALGAGRECKWHQGLREGLWSIGRPSGEIGAIRGCRGCQGCIGWLAGSVGTQGQAGYRWHQGAHGCRGCQEELGDIRV